MRKGYIQTVVSSWSFGVGTVMLVWVPNTRKEVRGGQDRSFLLAQEAVHKWTPKPQASWGKWALPASLERKVRRVPPRHFLARHSLRPQCYLSVLIFLPASELQKNKDSSDPPRSRLGHAGRRNPSQTIPSFTSVLPTPSFFISCLFWNHFLKHF